MVILDLGVHQVLMAVLESQAMMGNLEKMDCVGQQGFRVILALLEILELKAQ